MFWYQMKVNQLGFSGQSAAKSHLLMENKKKVKLERLLLMRCIRPWSNKVVNQVTKIKFADKNIVQ